MSEDPLHLGGFDVDLIGEAVEAKKTTRKAKDPIAKMNAETAAKREERLTTTGGPSAPPRGAAPPPPEPTVDKSTLLDKIGMFRERFPNIKSRNKVSAKSSVEEIEDELHYIEQQLGQRDGHMGDHLLVLAMSAIEEVTTKHYNPLNLQLNGLAQVTKDNKDQFSPILDELFIKYGAQMYVGPEMRLAMALGTMVYTVHSANTGNVAVAQALAKMGKTVPVTKTDL